MVSQREPGTAIIGRGQAVQQARERIIAGADIATPLRDSGVIDPAIAHIVSVGEKSGELEKKLQRAQDEIIKVRGVLGEFLDISRIEAGKLSVEQAEFELEKVMENVSNLVSEKATSKDCSSA
jgi:two-component system sensor histidine kinase/response regulator